MPERQKGRKVPETPQLERKEQNQSIYHQAAKYAGEVESEAPYDTLQELIRVEPCELSVYRLRLGEQLEYHVAVLGAPPEERLQRRIDDIFKDGEPVTLPQEVLDALLERRREQQKHGSWVERHHFPRKRRL
jgi:hypothetical protein